MDEIQFARFAADSSIATAWLFGQPGWRGLPAPGYVTDFPVPGGLAGHLEVRAFTPDDWPLTLAEYFRAWIAGKRYTRYIPKVYRKFLLQDLDFPRKLAEETAYTFEHGTEWVNFTEELLKELTVHRAKPYPDTIAVFLGKAGDWSILPQDKAEFELFGRWPTVVAREFNWDWDWPLLHDAMRVRGLLDKAQVAP